MLWFMCVVGVGDHVVSIRYRSIHTHTTQTHGLDVIDRQLALSPLEAAGPRGRARAVEDAKDAQLLFVWCYVFFLKCERR